MAGKHAFLCYSRQDAPAVDLLQAELEAAGVRVWRDTAQLWPGEDWREKVRQAIIDDALAFVACFSKNGLARDRSYQNEELVLAVDEFRLRRPDAPWLIPVRLDDCEIPDLPLGGGRTLGRLQRADLFGERRDQEMTRLVTAIGRILGLPAATSQASLAGAIRADPGWQVRSAYLAQVRDIAPDALIGRDAELADWAEFCAGSQAYAWWQADPWAGKTALASWFVTHPPAGTDILSFFITGRLVGQADSHAFLDAMIEQLDALNPVVQASALAAGPRVGAWLSLLASAAVRSAERGRRLVVVVDGLDEDAAGATPTRGKPSIASLLPRRPPPGVRLIVTSRPDPGLPDDLPGQHPLRACRPSRLSVSPIAKDAELLAQGELRELLSGDRVAVEVVGFIAGSGGGLTVSDLSELTGAPEYEVESVLRGVSGRSLHARAPADMHDPRSDPASRVYLFGHETLRLTAERQLGRELGRYRQKVHEWIDSYARAGWPGTTPGYALRGYPRLLASTADLTRLVTLARDRHRHEFLLRVTGGDYTTLSEIRTAQQLLADQDPVDLQAIVELAAHRQALSARNQYIPPSLPGVWAFLARVDRGEALARTITDPDDQARALAGVAAAIARSGDHDRGEALARTITRPDDQARALAGVAAAIARSGDHDRAEALARTITRPYHRAQALVGLAAAIARAGDRARARQLAADAETLIRAIPSTHHQAQVLADLTAAIARSGDHDRAEALARTITRPYHRAQALVGLAAAIAQAGDHARARQLAADAETLIRAISDPDDQAQALTRLASAIAQAGDHARARQLAADAETLIRAISDPDDQAQALTRLASAIAETGDHARAETLARTIPDPEYQAQALAGLAMAIARTGDNDRACQLAADAEAIARTITSYDQAWALAALATAIAQGADLDRAEAVARSIASYDQAWALAALATTIAQTGHYDRAEAIARTITSPYHQAQALAALATAIAQAGDGDRARQLAADAEALARAITDAADQAQALAGLAAAIAQAGDGDRARQLAADALAPAATRTFDQAQTLAGLAVAIAQAGDQDHAEALARTITIRDHQDQALADVATAIARSGDHDRAEALARTISDPYHQAQALVGLATAIARSGDHARAEALARTINDPYHQAQALAGLATAIAQVGYRDRARQLAADAEACTGAITDPDDQAQALADVAAATAQAGDHGRADRLLAQALTMDVPTPWWIASVAGSFPSAVGAAWEILADAYPAPQ